MQNQEANTGNEGEIRKLIDDWATAVHARDIERIMAFYAPDVIAYDLPPPLQFRGADAYRKDWETYLPMMSESMRSEMHELHIVADTESGFAHYLSHFTGDDAEGQPIDVWMRVTDCYSKIDGKWLIVHEHMSVPVDMESNKALFDAKP